MARPRPGFSIVEVMIYVSLVTVVMVVLAQFVADVTVNAARSKVVKEVEVNAQLTLQRLANEVRHAQAIVSIGSSQLVLRASDGSQVTLRLNTTSNAVERQDSVGTEAITTPEVRVTALSFTAEGQGVTMALTAAQGPTTVPASYQHQTTLGTIAFPRQPLY